MVRSTNGLHKNHLNSLLFHLQRKKILSIISLEFLPVFSLTSFDPKKKYKILLFRDCWPNV